MKSISASVLKEKRVNGHQTLLEEIFFSLSGLGLKCSLDFEQLNVILPFKVMVRHISFGFLILGHFNFVLIQRL